LIGADLHDEWRKLDRIELAIRQTATAGARPDEGDSRAAAVGEAPPTMVSIAPDLQPGDGATNGHGPAHSPDRVGAHAGNGAGKAPRPLLARARRAGSERPT
ncbi:MAG TPA: hypothetical protein VNY84_04865, partial [Acidimicrobiales bacterium]|nr:hypothetical protein [Acidimicrobiales bacterium]